MEMLEFSSSRATRGCATGDTV